MADASDTTAARKDTDAAISAAMIAPFKLLGAFCIPRYLSSESHFPEVHQLQLVAHSLQVGAPRGTSLSRSNTDPARLRELPFRTHRAARMQQYLTDSEQLNLKNEFGVRRNQPRYTFIPVSQMRPYAEPPPSTHAHSLDAP